MLAVTPCWVVVSLQDRGGKASTMLYPVSVCVREKRQGDVESQSRKCFHLPAAEFWCRSFLHDKMIHEVVTGKNVRAQKHAWVIKLYLIQDLYLHYILSSLLQSFLAVDFPLNFDEDEKLGMWLPHAFPEMAALPTVAISVPKRTSQTTPSTTPYS